DEIKSVLCVALSFDRRDGRSRASAGVRVERPIDAARLRIERIDVTGVAAEEDAAGRDGWLRMHLGGFGNPESPFEFQIRNLGRSQAGGARCLESCVLVAGAPAVPGGAGGRIGHWRIRRTRVRHLLDIARFIVAHWPSGKELRDLPLLDVEERR